MSPLLFAFSLRHWSQERLKGATSRETNIIGATISYSWMTLSCLGKITPRKTRWSRQFTLLAQGFLEVLLRNLDNGLKSWG